MKLGFLTHEKRDKSAHHQPGFRPFTRRGFIFARTPLFLTSDFDNAGLKMKLLHMFWLRFRHFLRMGWHIFPIPAPVKFEWDHMASFLFISVALRTRLPTTHNSCFLDVLKIKFIFYSKLLISAIVQRVGVAFPITRS